MMLGISSCPAVFDGHHGPTLMGQQQQYHHLQPPTPQQRAAAAANFPSSGNDAGQGCASAPSPSPLLPEIGGMKEEGPLDGLMVGDSFLAFE